MKTLPFVTLGLLAGALSAPAQFNFNFAFNSGSTGTTALNITSDTTNQLPDDGVLHYTTINVSAGATLRFHRNLANTPVYLLASGDVNIAGTIDVSGKDAPSGDTRVGGRGGPGGFDGGFPAFEGLKAGNGYGPGGGKGGLDGRGNCRGVAGSAGAGAYASAALGPYIASGYAFGYDSVNKGVPYGSPLLVPLVGGSGGGGGDSPGKGGGGGGGAILIASSTAIDLSGTIQADGGDGDTVSNCNATQFSHINPGSGGAIRLVAPVVTGNGNLFARGPVSASARDNTVGNWGRIRIDSIDRRNVPSSKANPAAQIGTYMVSVPPSRLDIVEVGTTNIFEGFGPVAIQLPTNADTNITVTVQARNFNSTNVPVSIVLTPENGPRSVYTTVLDNIANNPARSTIIVGLPVNTIVTISAWKP